MLPNTKIPKGGGLLLAGIAAFAYYKYSKMSQDEKDNLLSGLKEKGQKLYDQYMPSQVKDIFAQKGATNTNTSTDSQAYTV